MPYAHGLKGSYLYIYTISGICLVLHAFFPLALPQSGTQGTVYEYLFSTVPVPDAMGTSASKGRRNNIPKIIHLIIYHELRTYTINKLLATYDKPGLDNNKYRIIQNK